MSECLIELFSEEIPARMQAQALIDFKRLWEEALTAENLSFLDVKTYITPRRLVAYIQGLPLLQESRVEEIKGPRLGAPQQALDGFLKAQGVSLEECIIKETDKGSFYFAQINHAGKEVKLLLPKLIDSIIRAFPWPKSMRWADYQFKWVRPLHNIMAIFEGKPLEGSFDLGGCKLAYNNLTYGHRFLAPASFEVISFEQYTSELLKRFVILDQDERKESIRRQLVEKGAEKQICLKEDPSLLQEMTGASEWPNIFLGNINPEFLDVPFEVLETAMRVHQKYFSYRTKEGEFAPYFATVTNNVPKDGGKKIVQGNEQILKSRLFDAKFFWNLDREKSLASRTPKLASITFHAKLGNLKEKIERLQVVAGEIAPQMGADVFSVERAALLSKSDLVTGMVGEFPELQGIIGRYYALHDGEHPEIARAIAEHYAPNGPHDLCPKAPVSIALSIADKMDALVGFFANDLKPTGSKDPFALRRACLGIIRLILENKLRLSLGCLIEVSYKSYGEKVAHKNLATLQKELMEFFVERLKVFLREKGIRHDFIAAIFGQGPEDDLVRLCQRVDALSAFLALPDGRQLLAAYKRAGNILRIEEKKEARTYGGPIQVNLLKEEAEKSLFQSLMDIKAKARAKIELEEYDQAMKYLVLLRQPVDLFFEQITVNAEATELRENRLGLLSQIVSVLHEIADFQKIEG